MAKSRRAPPKHRDATELMTAAEWRRALQARPNAVRAALAAIYGEHPAHVASREAVLARLLEAFTASFGAAQPVVVARAPGRINLLGRHIDHRGGLCNLIAIHNDVWVVAAARADDRLVLHNLDREFGPQECAPTALWRAVAGHSWHDFIESETVSAYLKATRGAWTNYPLGAYLRLRREFGERVGGGLSAVFWGDVPRSVGLSSSSAVFVATAMALARLGRLEIEPTRFVELCGEGEWFVGTRGGAGDHAAMVFGRRGMVSQIGFFPICLARQAALPAHIEIILCNSGRQAQKSKEARDRFNARVAAYEIALAVMRQRWPRLTRDVRHLRDLSPAKLEVGVDRIYEMLKTIPSWMTRKDVACTLPEQIGEIETWFATHYDHEDGYPLRAVLLFGISECARSARALEVLSGGDAAQIGRLFAVSHNGDRVSCVAPRGRRVGWSGEFDDDYLDRLIRASRSDDPAERERAALVNQPGAYGCSTPEIDEMVDTATATEGVIGAQLVGAGLGGSIVALAHRGAAPRLREALENRYYGPHRLTPDVHVFQPVEGASYLTVE